MAIICTSDDNEFYKYKNLIKSRKVNFRIKDIFEDHWDNFVEEHPDITIRDIVFKSVQEIIDCGTKTLGFHLYECQNCKGYHFVYHTCKNKFCPSCGNKYNKTRATVIKSVLINHNHRHATFTIPEELRFIFRQDRKLLNLLFKAVDLTIKEYFKQRNIDATPAFICVLHTGGRSINWNPHIHVLLLEGGIKNGNLVKINFFSYNFFRKKFMYILLNLLEDKLGKKEFHKLKDEMWIKHGKEGFYVNIPNKKYDTLDSIIRYVSRYLSRPIMAESRILNYDGKYITFWYQNHKDEKIIIEKVHVYEFIKRLIIHIPDKQMKYIRYYGAYNNTSKNKANIFIKRFSDSVITGLKKLNYWQQSIMNDFKRNPLECPVCGSIMIYALSYFP